MNNVKAFIFGFVIAVVVCVVAGSIIFSGEIRGIREHMGILRQDLNGIVESAGESRDRSVSVAGKSERLDNTIAGIEDRSESITSGIVESETVIGELKGGIETTGARHSDIIRTVRSLRETISRIREQN